jgi:glutamate racemase
VKVIDSAEAAAQAAVELCNGRLEGRVATTAGGAAETEVRCFATDSVEKFGRLGSRFLGRPVGRVELIDLGG